jgi:hypothetical protein
MRHGLALQLDADGMQRLLPDVLYFVNYLFVPISRASEKVLLNLSEKTEEYHKHHIMKEFSLKSNADLVLFAVERSVVSVNRDSYLRAS